MVPLKPLPPGATELYVEASLPGVSPRQSEDVVVLSVPQRSVSRAAQVGPLAVVTPRRGGATRVLQASRRPVARDKGGHGVSLDVVDYDDAGNIVLSGRADANAEIRVYTDNRLIGTATSDKAGDWQLKPEARIAPGDHELRVDSVSVDGKVVARVVLPFSRADLQSIDLRDGRVVVQPGNSLWRIARATYGSGYQFTLIYDANRDQIDDPDLIFPGQVFKVPETN
ncbi:MAG: LysM peptidoglycan-binding domain-containing protein [Proteobacteria bacterium]|nr:LysM peptidoglycan-binding domain-containing protein [Pseudomonadota bacterium]